MNASADVNVTITDNGSLEKLHALLLRSRCTTVFIEVQIVDAELAQLEEKGTDADLLMKKLERRIVYSAYRDLCAQAGVEPQI